MRWWSRSACSKRGRRPLSETVGLRERAFDCFQVLIQLGREHESFEDVLEGFGLNCVRVLRE